MAQCTWILVANASNAKLYANGGPKKGLTLVKELAHPESRQKNSDLVTDRAGHMQSAGNGHGARQPQTVPKQHQAHTFATELARELASGRVARRFERAILVAPPAFMGMLNGAMDGQTSLLVSDRFEKDYTRVPMRELAGRLSARIYL